MKKKFISLMMLAGIMIPGFLPVFLQAADPAAELRSPGGSKMLTEWMNLHIKSIPNSTIRSHHTRQLAYMGVALYESVVAGDPDYRSLSDQLNGYKFRPVLPATKDFCWQASANAALAETFRYFEADNPVTLLRVDSLEQSCNKMLLAQGFSETAVIAGAKYGLQVAKAIIEWSKTDGADKAAAPYILPRGPGLYETTPPAFIAPVLPYLGNVRTFVGGSIENTTPPPPVAFSEDPQSPFYKMVDEVYRTSLENDAQKVSTALFWDDFPNGKTVTGGGHWESILKTVVDQMNMSLIESSRVFAELFITIRDAEIGCFKAKYTYNVLRPVTYVQKSMHKTDWQSLIVTPPHPEYPAAHATVSMSAATILTHVLGENVAFTDNTYAYRNYPAHHFKSFIEAAHEAGMSRLYGGIHYRPSIEAGFTQGGMIADNIAGRIVFKKNETLSTR